MMGSGGCGGPICRRVLAVANVDTGANLVTRANMNSARSQELLNPKIR
jgi:hypothetical protein